MTLARRKPDITALPAFDEGAATAEMLKQIDARAAQLEKIDAEVREWEKRNDQSCGGRSEKPRRSNRQRVGAIARRKKLLRRQRWRMRMRKLLQAILDALKPKFSGPIFLAGRKRRKRRIDRCTSRTNSLRNSGEQVDSADRANRRRKRRRPSGERTGCGERRQQGGGGTCESARASQLDHSRASKSRSKLSF